MKVNMEAMGEVHRGAALHGEPWRHLAKIEILTTAATLSHHLSNLMQSSYLHIF